MSTASPRATVASGQSSGSSSVEETTVAGWLTIAVTHGSRTSSSSSLLASILTKARNVVAPKTIRRSPAYWRYRWLSSSGPCLPQ